MRQPADEDEDVWLEQGELPVEMWPAKIDFGAAGSAVSPTRALAGEAFGGRGHVDPATSLRFGGEAGPHQPSHEHGPGASLEGQPADRFDRPGRLANEHDPVIGVPTQHGGGLWQVAGRDAPVAATDLSVEPRYG